MDFKTRICLWIILLGLINFVSYAVGYSVVGGEAVRGTVKKDPDTNKIYYFLDTARLFDKEEAVHRDTFFYIGIHSITIWPTVAAVILSMLSLARDRIADSMRSSIMRGKSFCTILSILVTISMSGLTYRFIGEFTKSLWHPKIERVPAKTQPLTKPAPDDSQPVSTAVDNNTGE